MQIHTSCFALCRGGAIPSPSLLDVRGTKRRRLFSPIRVFQSWQNTSENSSDNNSSIVFWSGCKGVKNDNGIPLSIQSFETPMQGVESISL
jgi:hypothetical protein